MSHQMYSGPVAALGKGRVLVAGEVREGGAGDLDQLELATAGLVVGDLDAAGGVAGQLQARRAVVGSVAAEEPVGGLEPVAVGRGDERGGEGEIATDHRQPLHVRVRVEEGGPDLEQPLLERTGARAQRDGMDEVLHRVGRHDEAVVALRVRVEELRPADDHLDLGRGQQVLAAGERRFGDRRDAGEWLGMRAIDLDIGLAVSDLVPHASSSPNRSTAARRMSASISS